MDDATARLVLCALILAVVALFKGGPDKLLLMSKIAITAALSYYALYLIFGPPLPPGDPPSAQGQDAARPVPPPDSPVLAGQPEARL